MLKIVDLIAMYGVKLDNFKIHCATGRADPPLEHFYAGTFKDWQECQNHKNFQCNQILSIIHLKNDKWLFAGIFNVNGFIQKNPNETSEFHFTKQWFHYDTTEVPGLEDLVGRVIVRFDKKFRASYLVGRKWVDQLIVAAIREERMSIGDFPGYASASISFRNLCTIVRQCIPSWESALSNVAGVYLITDCSTGKLYVGSAYGGEGIWQRWVSYMMTGHGGNKELLALLKEKGQKYADKFKFSVLEVCDLNANKDDVIGRETYWKDVLCSREFGYNSN